MAFFHNLNRDAIVRVLNSDNPKYEPIVAGEFLLRKHLASVGELADDADADSSINMNISEDRTES